jgi:acetyltransferase-like isoleucine patch superfamily enzyme
MPIQVSGTGTVDIGERANIGENVRIIFAGGGHVRFGDYCTLGPNVKLVVNGDSVVFGDWTSLHESVWVNSGHGITAGDHVWFGQNAIIDGAGGLTLGHGIRSGMFSQLWTHVGAGEIIEGCLLHGETPTVLEDYVWLSPSTMVNPGVRLGSGLMALLGSMITKSFPGNIIVGGSPAQQRGEHKVYGPITLEQKFSMMQGWLDEMVSKSDNALSVVSTDTQHIVTLASEPEAPVVFCIDRATAESALKTAGNASVCCLESKRYTKRLTNTEQRVLKYFAGNKARFRPWDAV